MDHFTAVRWCTLLQALLCMLLLGSSFIAFAAISPIHAAALVPYLISGTVYNDYEQNGIQEMPFGSTWGLAYRRSSSSLFAAAYFKRHAGFRPGGNPGDIYLINNPASGSPTSILPPL